RRGKYLLFECDDGWMLVHLGMSGTLRVFPASAVPPVARHDHIDWYFESCVLRYRDPRRFGAVLWHPRLELNQDILAHPLLANLGVEPLSDAFNGRLLYTRTRGR